MPIYEYRCDACAHEFDELQRMDDAPLRDCPSCGEPALIKKVSAAGFQLKGSGWYQTDFRGKKQDKKEAAGDAAPACTPTGCEQPGCATAAKASAAASKPGAAGGAS